MAGKQFRRDANSTNLVQETRENVLCVSEIRNVNTKDSVETYIEYKLRTALFISLLFISLSLYLLVITLSVKVGEHY